VNSKTIGTIRTGVPAAWATFLTWVVAKFGLHLSDEDYGMVLLALTAVIPVFSRAAREVEVRWPAVGRILFGSAQTPVYGDAEPRA
jgi:hypothetical protein